MADTAVAGLEQRWSNAPLSSLTDGSAPAIVEAKAIPAPPTLVKLLSTTQPAMAVTESITASSEGPKAIPETSVPINLIGTMAGINGAGVAMITLGGEDLVVESGQPLEDWTVLAVNPTSVLLGRAGATLTLELDQPAELLTKSKASAGVQVAGSAPPPIQAAAPAATPAAAVGDATPAPPTPAAPVEPLKSKDELVSLLSGDQMGTFSKQGGLKPVLREGEIAGYQIRVKDPAFPLARLGLQNGDIVKALNGVPASGPETVSTYMRTLKNSSTLNFEIEREGKTLEHRVELE